MNLRIGKDASVAALGAGLPISLYFFSVNWSLLGLLLGIGLPALTLILIWSVLGLVDDSRWSRRSIFLTLVYTCLIWTAVGAVTVLAIGSNIPVVIKPLVPIALGVLGTVNSGIGLTVFAVLRKRRLGEQARP